MADPAMQPVAIGRSRAWLHLPARPCAAGVILCPALGREARWTYRTMRRLAVRLAASGLPTLRFDYPGTGDSPDLAPGEEPWRAWQDSVADAIEWLRQMAGLDEVMLCGMRFGALLAADVAARRQDIAALALLGPMPTGRVYARELRLAAFGADPADAPDDGIEVDGIGLPESTLAALAILDLRTLPGPPAPHLLVVDDNPRTLSVCAGWQSSGAETSLQPFPGYAAMMRPATSNQIPEAAIGAVADWFAALRPKECPKPVTPLPATRWPSPPGYRERPIQFGKDRRLVGTLCEPPVSHGRAVLIPCTGGDARSGIARFGVHLARHLASSGVASLRFDFAGQGDSTLPSDAEAHVYETARHADMAAALDLLQGLGYRNLGGVGLCTGAYHLLHAAYTDQRLQRLVLVNLVTFHWEPGDIVEVPQRPLGQSFQADSLRPNRPGERTAIRAAVSGLLARNVSMLVVLGAGDPGVAALEASFGPGGEALTVWPNAEIRIEPGIDHTLSRRVMQDQVAEAACGFLTRRCTVTEPNGPQSQSAVINLTLGSTGQAR